MLILSNFNALIAKKGKLWAKDGRRRRRKRRRRPILAPRAAPPLARPAAKNLNAKKSIITQNLTAVTIRERLLLEKYFLCPKKCGYY